MLNRVIIVLIVIISLSSCDRGKREAPDSKLFETGKNLAQIKGKKLKEVSGIAASRVNEGLLWMHNDSGNDPEIYLVDEHLDIKLTCILEVENRDWEDIAVGPGPDSSKTYVYVGDIGDNLGRHDYKFIYRFEEPVLGTKKNFIVTEVDTLTIYLDEPKDTETLMVDPLNADIYLISKWEDEASMYKIHTPSESDTLKAEKVSTLPLTTVVSGGISPDGSEILVKTHQNVFYWKRNEKSIAEAMKAKPFILEYEEEPQGESISFAADGSGYYTISEKVKGEKSYLKFYRRSE